MIAQDDHDRPIAPLARLEKRQQATDLAVGVLEHLTVTRLERFGRGHRPLARIVRQTERIVSAVGGDEFEERHAGHQGIVAPDFVDPPRHDVAIGRRLAVGDEVDHGRVPGRQPVILMIEMRIGADVGRVVTEIAEPRGQAVEASI